MSRKKTSKKAKTKGTVRAKARVKTTKPRKVVKKAAPSGRRRVRVAKAAAPVVSARQRALDALVFARGMTRDLVQRFREDQALYQVVPSDNHLMWTLGHLAVSFDWFAGLLDGKPSQCPEQYQAMFGFKSAPTSTAGAYPGLAEVVDWFERTYERFIGAVKAMGEGEMLLATMGDSFGFAKDRLEVIERAAWHEGWHAGQLSTLRRALGIPPIMG
ncbi:MAG: DinB family protein [Phycisphaerales bacterium]|jgi:hypothetical protein|nr:DinB family protein [Phycisphaerales bacterium]